MFTVIVKGFICCFVQENHFGKVHNNQKYIFCVFPVKLLNASYILPAVPPVFIGTICHEC